MTSLSERKTKLIVETADAVRERGKLREVVIECSSPYFCTVRLKGTRTRFPISYASIYNRAASIAAEAARAERKAAKKAGKHAAR